MVVFKELPNNENAYSAVYFRNYTVPIPIATQRLRWKQSET